MGEVDLLRAWRDETRNTPEHRSHKLTISASRHWQTVNRLLDHADELEAIVRPLAASDQVVNLGGDRFGDYVCMACPEEWELPYIEQESDLTHHEACPWVLAKRWVEANPEEQRG